MSIEEIDDYPEKMNEVELHWGSVNTSLGGTPETEFKLLGGFDRSNFAALRTQVSSALTTQEQLENDLDFARADRDSLRGDLRKRISLFRDSVKELLPGSKYIRALPDTPQENAEPQKHLDALDDAAHIWGRINTDQPAEVAPELTLRGGYTLANITADIATMRQRFEAVKEGERATSDGRGERDVVLGEAYERMVQYRARLPLTLEEDDPLLASMPRITPPKSGGGGGPVTTFRCNWLIDGEGNVVYWFEHPPNVSGVTQIYLREGTAEVTAAVNLLPGQSQQVVWSGVTLSGGIDEMKLRDGEGNDLAIGERDETLPDPGP